MILFDRPKALSLNGGNGAFTQKMSLHNVQYLSFFEMVSQRDLELKYGWRLKHLVNNSTDSHIQSFFSDLTQQKAKRGSSRPACVLFCDDK